MSSLPVTIDSRSPRLDKTRQNVRKSALNRAAPRLAQPSPTGPDAQEADYAWLKTRFKPGTWLRQMLKEKYDARANSMRKNMNDTLNPVISWLLAHPKHQGRLGRIPKAKFTSLCRSRCSRGQYGRYMDLWQQDGFVAETQILGVPFIDVTYFNDFNARRHYEQKCEKNAALKRAQRGKKRQADATQCAHGVHTPPLKTHPTPTSEASCGMSTAVILREERDEAEAQGSAPPPALLVAQGDAPPLPVGEVDGQESERFISSVQQPAQPASGQTAAPAAPPEAERATQKVADATVGRVKFIFDPSDKRPISEQILAFGQCHPETDNPRIPMASPSLSGSVDARKPSPKTPKPVVAPKCLPLTPAIVASVNKQFGMNLQFFKLRSAGITDDSLLDAAYFAWQKHQDDPFDSLEGTVVNSAMQRSRGEWT